jgi:hypothetical protein
VGTEKEEEGQAGDGREASTWALEDDMVEHLPSKHEAPSSNPSAAKKNDEVVWSAT